MLRRGVEMIQRVLCLGMMVVVLQVPKLTKCRVTTATNTSTVRTSDTHQTSGVVSEKPPTPIRPLLHPPGKLALGR